MLIFSLLFSAFLNLARCDDKAFLLVKKSLVGDYAVQGKNATVQLELYNAGDSAAYGVSVNDVEYPEEYFELVEGDLSASFDRVSAGGVVKHSYVLKAKVSGPFILRPATVTYRAESDSADEHEVSSTASIMRIISPAEARTVTLLRVGSYVSLGALQTVEHWRNSAILITLSALIIGGYLVYNTVTIKTVERRRKTAQKDLGLEDEASD